MATLDSVVTALVAQIAADTTFTDMAGDEWHPATAPIASDSGEFRVRGWVLGQVALDSNTTSTVAKLEVDMLYQTAGALGGDAQAVLQDEMAVALLVMSPRSWWVGVTGIKDFASREEEDFAPEITDAELIGTVLRQTITVEVALEP